MRLEKCWFCSSTVYPGHGIVFVRNDCKIFRFCRSKCHNNFKMKRNPRKVAWTKAYRRGHGKELVDDKTFEFERRRNRPEKYDRVVVQKTVKAIKRVAEIRQAREARLHTARMAGGKQRSRAAAAKQLEQEIHLVQAAPELAGVPQDAKQAKKLKVAVALANRPTTMAE